MAIPVHDKFKTGGYVRPKDDIDPLKKQGEPEYSLDSCKFIYGKYLSGSCAIKNSDVDLITENRLYSEGRQPGQRYKDSFLGKGDGPKIRTNDIDSDGNNLGTASSVDDIIEGITNLNYDDIFSPLPKYVSNIIGLMTANEHDVTVEAEDENSGTMREEMKFDGIIRNEHKKLLDTYNEIFKLPELQDNVAKPKSLEEIELFENIGAFKLPYEIAMEKLISHTEYVSKDTDIKEEVIRDLITIGVSSVMTFVNNETGKAEYKWLDVLDTILEDSKKIDFADATYGGYVDYISILNLRVKTGLTEEKLLEIVRLSGGDTSRYGLNIGNNGSYEYDDYKVAILECYWKSIDSEYTQNRRTEDGTIIDIAYSYDPKTGKPPKEGKKGSKTTSRTDIRRIYKASWVINTEHVFDYGLMHDIPYNYAKRDVEFPIHMIRIKGKPIMESLKTIEDQIMLAYLRMQNDIATSNPQGIAVEYGSLENISFGNKKLKPKDVLKIYSKTGRLMFRLQPSGIPGQQGKALNQRPITEIKGGLSDAVNTGFFTIQNLYQQLDIISGIDAITVANARPQQGQGKGVTEMAIASTADRLKPIYGGWLKMKEARSRCAVYTMQAIVYGYDELNDCPYYKVVGSGNLSAIKTAGPIPAVDYGFRLEARPTEAERREVFEAAKLGLAGGKNGIPALTYSEYLFVLRHITNGHGKSIKYIEVYLAKKEAEKEEQAHKRAMETQQLQIDGALKQKEEDRKAIVEKNKAEQLKEIEVVKEKGTQERMTLDLKYKYDMQLKALELKNAQANTQQV